MGKKHGCRTNSRAGCSCKDSIKENKKRGKKRCRDDSESQNAQNTVEASAEEGEMQPGDGKNMTDAGFSVEISLFFFETCLFPEKKAFQKMGLLFRVQDVQIFGNGFSKAMQDFQKRSVDASYCLYFPEKEQALYPFPFTIM